MFVHSGASLHGHEFSSQSTTQPQPQPRRFPSLFSARRPNSDINPITPESSSMSPPSSPTESFPPSRPVSVTEPLRHSSLSSRRRPYSDVPHVVRFREPQSDIVHSNTPSEDEESLFGSELSYQTDNSTRQKRRKRALRKSTRFALAYPAPQSRMKHRSFLQIRPRLWLQLQEVSDKRAIPAFDVVPSTMIAGTFFIPKLAKRFPRMFLAKPHLGQNDLLLVRSEDYSTFHGHHTPSSSLDHKDVLAVLSPTSNDEVAEIVLQDGSVWMTSRMANGSYEFIHVNEQGDTIKARWVKRALNSPRASWASASAAYPLPAASGSPDSKWTFSIIDPSTRRHPIQGVLTPTTLDIYDTYSTMSTSSGRYPPTRAYGSDISGITEELTANMEERTTMDVTKEDKTLMIATAVWLGLRQKGWPASATPKMSRVVSQCRNIGSESSGRSQSFPIVGDSSKTRLSQDHPIPIRHSSVDTPSQLPNSGMIKRAVSSGSEFMRKRREAFVADLVEMEAEEDKNPSKLRIEQEETFTCRLSLRHLAQKLFHPGRSEKMS